MKPFSSSPEDTVASLGEIALLGLIRQWLGAVAPPCPEGMGDDAAVLNGPPSNLITTDSLVYGRHFDDGIAPEIAGAKLLKRNLSDIAAMGGSPGAAVMAGFLPPDTSLDWLKRFTCGLAACARQFGVPVVGGDLTQTDTFLGFNLTLLGDTVSPLLRTGARIGDLIWVTGELGGSLLFHHHAFTPRLAEGQWMAQQDRDIIHAVIDITDGLAKDLPALLPPKSGAALDVSNFPIRNDAHEAARQSGRPILEHVFSDGEDYELLFMTDPCVGQTGFKEFWARHFDTKLTCIGEVVTSDSPASLIDARTGAPLQISSGYEHFGKA